MNWIGLNATIKLLFRITIIFTMIYLIATGHSLFWLLLLLLVID